MILMALGAGRNRRVAGDSVEYAGTSGARDGAAEPVPPANFHLHAVGGDAGLAGAGQLSRAARRLWLVIPIMMLWGNLHGGFIIGIATLAGYTLPSSGCRI